MNILEMTALEQSAAVAEGRISSVALVRFYLDRIEQQNQVLQAFTTVTPKLALKSAQRCDAERQKMDRRELPLFHGVPVGIKDLVPTRGIRTRMGSRAFRYFVPPLDGIVAKRIYAGGFVSLGKLSTSEFGVLPVTEPLIHPPTRNPWHLNHTPGGSSGGSGAAVAAGLLPIAHGSDGGGSVRIPAAFCHLFGFKPSLSLLGNLHGRINNIGLSVMGPLAHTVADAAAMLDVMAGRPHGGHRANSCLQATRSKPRPLRIGVYLRSAIGEVDPVIAAATEDMAQTLESLGHAVKSVDGPPGSLQEFVPLWSHIVSRVPSVSEGVLQPITQWLRMLGRELDPADIRRNHEQLCSRIMDIFDDLDVLLTPTVGCMPPAIGSLEGPDPEAAFARYAEMGSFTAIFNLTSGPAANIPAGVSASGLPFGIQLGGRVGHDLEILSLSAQVEAARPWRARKSPRWHSPAMS